MLKEGGSGGASFPRILFLFSVSSPPPLRDCLQAANISLRLLLEGVSDLKASLPPPRVWRLPTDEARPRVDGPSEIPLMSKRPRRVFWGVPSSPPKEEAAKELL